MLSILELVLRGTPRPNLSSLAHVKKDRTRINLEKEGREKVKFYRQAYDKNKPKKSDIKMLGTRRFKGVTRK